MPTDTHTPARSLAPTFLGVTAALLVCAVLIIGGLVARPAGGLKLPTGYTVVHVDEFDYGFHIPAGPLPSGKVLFVDTNRGSIPHELVMFKTASATAALPMRKDGDLDEDSSKLENVVDSGSALAPGESRVMSADLEPGSYLIVCNLPSHLKLGMHEAVTVK
jgi:uncharacterized cupredoxin-like copper-binding protein